MADDDDDEYGLADPHESASQSTCPGCGRWINEADNVKLCVHCGYNFVTGETLQTKTAPKEAVIFGNQKLGPFVLNLWAVRLSDAGVQILRGPFGWPLIVTVGVILFAIGFLLGFLGTFVAFVIVAGVSYWNYNQYTGLWQELEAGNVRHFDRFATRAIPLDRAELVIAGNQLIISQAGQPPLAIEPTQPDLAQLPAVLEAVQAWKD